MCPVGIVLLHLGIEQEPSTFVKSRGISYVNSVSTSEGNYLLALRYTWVLISP
jgi:hypothetical protein